MFIHSPVDGHLGGFRLLAVVNDAAVNVGVRISLSILLGIIHPEVDFPDPRQFYFQVFETPPNWLYYFTFPSTRTEGSEFSTPLPTRGFCLFACLFLTVTTLVGVRWYLLMALIGISIMISDVSTFPSFLNRGTPKSQCG